MEERDDKVLDNYPAILRYIKQRAWRKTQRLESRWRKENVLLKLSCEDGVYVFKRVSGDAADSEILRMKLLRSYYPLLIPKIYAVEQDAYLMGHIDGRNFFELRKDEKLPKILRSSKILSDSWNRPCQEFQDISSNVRKSFQRYRKKAAVYFSEEELRIDDFAGFSRVPCLPSHNDLNSANLLYDGEIKLIDASEEGYEDIARDIGRYVASVFFNEYDYFGNDKQFSLELAEAFLSSFSQDILLRAKYFIGESFLSFINFPTYSTPKQVLKDLAISTLEKDKEIIRCLEEAL